jgi:hypothetical protein
LVERLVRNEKVRGSNPLTSTTLILNGLQRRSNSGSHRRVTINMAVRVAIRRWVILKLKSLENFDSFSFGGAQR